MKYYNITINNENDGMKRKLHDESLTIVSKFDNIQVKQIHMPSNHKDYRKKSF